MRIHIFTCAATIVCATSCYKESKYEPLSTAAADVIEDIHTSKMELRANNSDTTLVTVLLPEDARTGLDIVLTTSRGVFPSSGTATVTVKSKAVQWSADEVRVVGQATLRNGLGVGTIEIEANVLDYSRSDTLSSIFNQATSISLSATALALSNNPTAEVQITAQVGTNGGTVSEGQPIQIVALDALFAQPIGSFRVRPSAADGNGRGVFTYGLVPDSMYTGAFHVIATTTSSTQTYRDTLTLYAID